ncbi:MAG TPA: hypothetical protein VKU02_06640 [Gemmataceae bacterium]|nr:hypothetical protein [Gemmataceae bacterium]
MSRFHTLLHGPGFLVVCVGVGIALVAGCGDSSSNLVPVVGKVIVDGKPLTTGTGIVNYRPEKGSLNHKEPAAKIEPDGTYRLTTDGKEGAPPGRYRVLVVDVEEIDPKNGFPYGKRRSHVNYKYGDLKTTDLVIEVVPSPGPGAYDLKLKK